MTRRYWLGLSDWTLNAGNSKPSYGNQTAATLPYRNFAGCSGGRDNTTIYVFAATLPVNPAKTLTSVTLPNGATQGQQHIFAIGTTTAAMSGPVAASVTPATASPGQQVTISGSGFGSTQGSGYVALTDEGNSAGAMSDAPGLQIATAAGSFRSYCYTPGSHVCTADSQGNLNNSCGCAAGQYNSPNLPVAKSSTAAVPASGSTNSPTRNMREIMAGHTASAPGRQSTYQPTVTHPRTSR